MDLSSFFKTHDFEQINKRNITEDYLKWQIETFLRGNIYTNLHEPATIKNNGIKQLNQNTLNFYINYYTKYNHNLKITKFVPASGAATRMFKDLYDFLEKDTENLPQNIKYFYDNLKKFAFFDELYENCLRNNIDINNDSVKNVKEIINILLSEKGLNYGNLPKALLKFHRYNNGSRTPIEEHITEALSYAISFFGTNIHFTASPEHVTKFKEHIKSLIGYYEDKYKTSILVDITIQNPSTDTLAFTEDNKPFRDDNNNLIFRPAGHGALIHNLNNINSDIIFIKNIDNVVPDFKRDVEINYKKALAGILLENQNKIFEFINQLLNNPSIDTINEAFNFLLNNLQIRILFDFNQLSRTEKIEFLLKKLDRPLRVCGMVKNTGEPGGGPFFVFNEKEQTASLQIVEKAQINLQNPEQKKIFEESTHFNPVDIVLSPMRYNGEKFDLLDYVDKSTYFISEKFHKGKILKALELPGLWNGSMADWNTIFVEVPLQTFNPVKTVFDLLRESHL